ncbi:hypothetical protein [Ascidiaceihabitans sp.]|uniref:hypothetical protein n=1 Tax=Ascidiaceihabitans sp. TaxID=1872644 RepID=UPI00329945DD
MADYLFVFGMFFFVGRRRFYLASATSCHWIVGSGSGVGFAFFIVPRGSAWAPVCIQKVE